MRYNATTNTFDFCFRPYVDRDCNTEGASSLVGNPVSVLSGRKIEREQDYQADGPFPLSFGRTYNSGSFPAIPNSERPIAPLGFWWRHDYERAIFLWRGTRTTTVVYRPNGAAEYFYLDGTQWIGRPDQTTMLTSAFDGNGNPTSWTYSTQDGMIEAYDGSGRLLSITNRAGLTQTLSYDDRGRLLRVTDPFGHALAFAYDAKDHLVTLTDPNGNLVSYGYDANNNLKNIDYPDGTSKRYHYEDSRFPNHLTGITDERGIRYATYQYDTQGRAIASYHAGNADRVDIAYNADGTRTVTNSRGNASTYTTATQLGVSLVTNISGPSCSTCGTGNTSYSYDPATNNLLSKTENGTTTQYGNYDTNGNYGYKIEAVGTPQQRRFDYTYDPRFHSKIATLTEASVYAAGQKITTYTYDDSGNRTSERIDGYRPDGTPVSRTTTYQYNGPLHQLSQIDGPRSDVADITTFDYHPFTAHDPDFPLPFDPDNGRLLRVTGPSGVLRDNILYTSTGKVASETRPNGLRITYGYYPGNDRLERMTQTDTLTGQTRTTRWTYLATGEVESITQGHGTPEATTLTLRYDDARRLTRIQDGLGNYMEYTLDTEGNQEAEKIYDASGVLKKQLSQTFDQYNRLDVSAQLNEAQNHDFAPDGTLDKLTDGRNTVTDYS